MPRNFTEAMRGAVLQGRKPMGDFVALLYRDDRQKARLQPVEPGESFRAQHALARHKLTQPQGDAAPAVTWLQAGDLICGAAQKLLQATPAICPETALRQTVHAVNKGALGLRVNRGGFIRLG